eukprot:gene12207-12344_t
MIVAPAGLLLYGWAPVMMHPHAATAAGPAVPALSITGTALAAFAFGFYSPGLLSQVSAEVEDAGMAGALLAAGMFAWGAALVQLTPAIDVSTIALPAFNSALAASVFLLAALYQKQPFLIDQPQVTGGDGW